MTLYSGKCITSASATVTGRLCHAQRLDLVTDSARILLWDGIFELSERLLRSSVGVICMPDIDSEGLIALKRIADICHVPAIELECSLCNSDMTNKIAIIDVAMQRVYVDPDIETINRYFGSKHQNKSKDISVLVNDDKSTSECDGIVINECDIAGKHEETIYELLCDMADKNTGARIVVKVPFDTDVGFVSYIRAVYRASVWGVFSLLCTGIYTPTDAKHCVSLIHSAFRELDSEGREFNGFIPKGVLVQTPLMLLEGPNHKILDHYCLDLSTLTSLFCGGINGSVSKIIKYIRSFIRNSGSADIFVDIKDIEQLDELVVLCQHDNIKGIYTRRELVANVRSLF